MKKLKSSLLLIILSFSVLLLSACSSQPSGKNDGFFHTYFVEPFAKIIHFFAEVFSGNYGLAIIFVTLIIRLVLMPLMLRQYKNQMHMKEKMDALKPEMDAIQKKMKAEKDPKKKQELQAEMMGLYQKHGVNPLNMGCLPILIQMPILTGFYYAIRGSQEIASHKFLWFSLGHPDIVITIIAGIIYYFQFRVSQSTMPEQQRQQMKFMGLMSPLMIVMFSFSAPAALPLYWVVGGTFLTVQTLISQKLYAKKPAEAQAK
ncbi:MULTISPECIES: membrane protein insertase YidC [Neobacillus]|uniref:Membrane protein insertase YidC n=1 Tax=Neobacillus rhizophilus TaxID=2833579 RepID=A0A942YXI2_9BACI|nr:MULTISPECIES: membrane protein insertase YidC [Neobacillus]MBS4216042.1 membrane protein insertase YidC [Neobacillus rhizophilus]MBU8919964.1 membrane protein insertase YidC [Bacillus sp. FJAT-29953]